MNIQKTELPGVYELENLVFEDCRGKFVKVFNETIFEAYDLNTDFKESFYSVSNKNVIRGMHYQLPPMDHEKLVYVVSGSIIDVIVNVDRSSKFFGKYIGVELNDESCKGIYIGKGYAHGFLTTSGTATVCYLTTTVHSKEHDTGTHWNGFGYDWCVDEPIISERDRDFSVLRSL